MAAPNLTLDHPSAGCPSGGISVLFGKAGPTSHGKPAVVDSHHRALFVMLSWWGGGVAVMVGLRWWRPASEMVGDTVVVGK